MAWKAMPPLVAGREGHGFGADLDGHFASLRLDRNLPPWISSEVVQEEVRHSRAPLARAESARDLSVTKPPLATMYRADEDLDGPVPRAGAVQ